MRQSADCLVAAGTVFFTIDQFVARQPKFEERRLAVGEGFEPSLGLYTLNRFSNPSIAVSGTIG